MVLDNWQIESFNSIIRTNEFLIKLKRGKGSENGRVEVIREFRRWGDFCPEPETFVDEKT